MSIEMVKFVIYGVMIACFVAAGTIDISQGGTKEGVIALAFAMINGIIFFWRP